MRGARSRRNSVSSCSAKCASLESRCEFVATKPGADARAGRVTAERLERKRAGARIGRLKGIQPISRFGKVAVLMGGRSAEREVSLKSGSMVLAALTGKGIDAHPLDPRDAGLDLLIQQKFDRAF